MAANPFDLCFDELPESIPIFPLGGVVLLPRGDLPLNIFEPGNLDMVQDVLKTDRLIGMVQPMGAGGDALFHVGCAGRITQFQETEDGRILINLRGVCRFRIDEELPTQRNYRRVRPIWDGFERDMQKVGCLDIDRVRLGRILKTYFDREGLHVDWGLMDDIPDEGLMTALVMICPFSPPEKQALLEAPCCFSRADLFFRLLDICNKQLEGCLSEH